MSLPQLSPKPAGTTLKPARPRDRRKSPPAKTPRRPPDQRSLAAIPAETTSMFASLRRTLLVALIVSIVGLGGGAYFLSQTVIAGAVVTHGDLVVENGAKTVQHHEGGVVSKLLAAEDQAVKAGQVLVILDQKVAKAKLQAVASSLVQQRFRLVRLQAERDMSATVVFPAYAADTPVAADEYARLAQSERRQFELRQLDRQNQKDQIGKQIQEVQSSVNSARIQLASLHDAIGVISKQLTDMRTLFAQNLISSQRIADLELNFAQFSTQQASAQSTIDAGAGRIAGLKVALDGIDQKLGADITDQLSAAQGAVADLTQQLVVAQDTLARTSIRAPQDGVIHELVIHTVGGVVGPGEVMMLVVPRNDSLIGEIRISPTDIDQVYPGQPVEIHFSSFDRATTPRAMGKVVTVSPDSVEDKRTGGTYYTARIEADATATSLGLPLVPGMPLEAYVKTDDRTILSYLMKPLTDQFERAFR